jgi:uncharacterized membrane protein
VPPDEPGPTPEQERTGTARPDQGRHRHGRPGTTPLTPPTGAAPVPPRPPAVPARHARPGDDSAAPPDPSHAPRRDGGPANGRPGAAAPDETAGSEAPTPPTGWSRAIRGGAPPERSRQSSAQAPQPRTVGAAWVDRHGRGDDAGERPPTGRDAADGPAEDRSGQAAEPSAAGALFVRAAAPSPPRAAGPTGHGHGHGHSPAAPAGRRVRLLIAALLVPCAVATLVGLVLLWPASGPPPSAHVGVQQPVHAEVTAARGSGCTPGSGDGGCVALVLRMDDGPLPGRDLVQVVPVEPGSPTFGVGDAVVLEWSGADPVDPGSYRLADFQRGGPLLWLAAIFAAAVLLLGRWRGLAALAALVLSFAVLLMFVLPAILSGHDPLAVAVVGSCLIMFAVLYLTHGPSARTSTAVLGTLLSLALIGALGAAFSAAARLTGLDDQTSNLIASLGTGVDARGLLLAGVVIGALGVLDDVTVTQTSAVWELRRANPELGAPALFGAAMRIGRDHVASAVNTLVLAYAGAALPLLLLFTLSGRGLGDVVTTQDVATEVVRTLVGSIGLVASVPITTALAAMVASRETPEALRV